MKCYESGIEDDKTDGKLACPECGNEYARSGMIHGRPARKIIQGKVTTKGHIKK